MRNTRTLLTLLVLSLLLLTGCTSGESVMDKLEKWSNAAVPIEPAAFIPVDLSPLRTPYNFIKIPCVVICLVFCGMFLKKWQEYDGDLASYIEGMGFWTTLIVLFGGFITIVSLLDESGRAAWLVKEFAFIRDCLGWEIPSLQRLLPSGDVNPATLAGAVAAIETTCLWHAAWQIALIIMLPICMVIALLKKSWTPLIIWGFGAFLWVFYGYAFYLTCIFTKAYRGEDPNLLTSSLKQTNGLFAATLLIEVGVFSFIHLVSLGGLFMTMFERGGSGHGRFGTWAREAGQFFLIGRAQPEAETVTVGHNPGYSHNPGPGRDGDTVIYGQDPRQRKQLPPPKRLLGRGDTAGSSSPPGPEGSGGPTPKGKGGGQLPKARGPREEKAHNLSVGVGKVGGALVGGALTSEAGLGPQAGAGAGAQVGGELVDKLPGPSSMVEQQMKAVDRAAETLGGGEPDGYFGQPDERPGDGPLPPPRPLGGATGGTDEVPPTGGGSRFAGFSTQPAGSGRTKYYVDGDIVDPEGRILYRNGQRVFPNEVTDEGLNIGEDRLPWESVTIEGEVS